MDGSKHNAAGETLFGQALIEYALLITLVAVVVLAVLLLFGEDIAAALGGVDWSSGGGVEEADAGLSVQVVTEDEQPLAAARVFLYSGDGETYQALFADTDAAGAARLAPEPGRYQLLTIIQQQLFWSDPFDFPATRRVQLTVPVARFEVLVVDMNGTPLADVPVYAYSADETYMGVEGVTGTDGVAALSLAAGHVQIRADYDGQVHWSSPVPPEAHGTTVVVTACGTGAFLASYFDGTDLSGEPLVSRCEAAVDYNWGGEAPLDGVGRDRFSATWTGRFRFEPGAYLFSMTGDDGVRLWVDNDLVIDAWRTQGATTYGARVALDGVHEIRMTYFEQGGNAVARLRWQGSVSSCPQNQFLAEYYDNRTLAGEPSLTVCESSIDHNWGGGNVGGVGSNNVSVRWSGAFTFGGGAYEFSAVADDGVVVWVDNERVIDAWRDQSATTYRARLALSPGVHQVTMQYYEAGGNAMARLSWVER